MINISLKNATVSFPLEGADQKSLKRWLAIGSRGKIARAPFHDGLKDVSLNIRHGERVGLIGLNGAGKTTMLKTLAGIYHPTQGSVEVNGRVSSILDAATGFEIEMTGVENIYIRGLLLGMTVEEVKAKTPEIIAFSELGDYVYQPVRTYSAGMFVRLAFATTTSIEPDILIMDEVIGAGDASFIHKAEKRVRQLIERGQIVVLSSHAMQHMHEFCTRCIWLHQGKVLADGAVDDVVKEYEAFAAKGLEWSAPATAG